MQPYHPYINTDVVKMYPSRIASGKKTAILTFVTSQAAYQFIDHISFEGEGIRAVYKETTLSTDDDINTYMMDHCQECIEEGPTVEEALAIQEELAKLSIQDCSEEGPIVEEAVVEEELTQLSIKECKEKTGFISLIAPSPSPLTCPPSPHSLSFSQINTLVELFQKASLDPRMEDALRYMPEDHPLRSLGDFIIDYSSASSSV
jgi:hypothetical protein